MLALVKLCTTAGIQRPPPFELRYLSTVMCHYAGDSPQMFAHVRCLRTVVRRGAVLRDWSGAQTRGVKKRLAVCDCFLLQVRIADFTICTHTYIYTDTYIYIIHTCAYMYIYRYIYRYIYMCMWIYIYVHIYIESTC